MVELLYEAYSSMGSLTVSKGSMPALRVFMTMNEISATAGQ